MNERQQLEELLEEAEALQDKAWQHLKEAEDRHEKAVALTLKIASKLVAMGRPRSAIQEIAMITCSICGKTYPDVPCCTGKTDRICRYPDPCAACFLHAGGPWCEPLEGNS